MQLRKETRWYDDACGTAHALELIGERWSLLIVRELMFGPQRFGELRGGLPGISAKTLTERLAGLEAAGIVERRERPELGYALTAWGEEARPLIRGLGRWAARSPTHDPGLPLSPVSLMLSFETMFAAERAGDAETVIAFRLRTDRFTARVVDAKLSIERGEREGVDAVVQGEPEAVALVAYAGAPLTGALVAAGDREAAARFLSLFALPPKAF